MEGRCISQLATSALALHASPQTTLLLPACLPMMRAAGAARAAGQAPRQV